MSYLDKDFEDRPYNAEPVYAKEQRESKIPFDQQDKSLAELHEYLELLSDKLRPVLTPVIPSDESTEMKAAENEVISPVAETVVRNNNSLRLAIRRVRSLIDRVEC